ncbi:LysE family translocator [Bacillus sp. T33-2]|uniref:LysE family translocator n=1 Tax=Bacillus sp. T33-2 TaxID=2054168 RepID=UPI000C783220|nr:LysE family translocator [Bacillus sp. T33-2]PLR89133.1 lysine transporter LysE [Bacillus sp. T33-2]
MLMFVLVVLTLFLIPGPAVLLTVGQSLRGGRNAGIFTGMGIAVGDLIHTLASVLGLSAILMTSALAFDVVKYLGAFYLVFLGIKAFLDKPASLDIPVVQKTDPSRSFRQAILIELLNPKTALFFLAFLPQFVRPDGLPVVYQLMILGLTFVLMSILYTTFIAFIAGSVSIWISRKKNSFSRWQGKIIGVIYLGLGLQLVFQNER